jgi:hypothetical protein
MKLLLVVFALACVSTQATRLAGFDPSRGPTCWPMVQVFSSPEAVGAPFVEVAYLRTSSSDPVGDDKLIQSMKEKAAEVGANGILLRGITERSGRAGLITGAFTAKPEGEAVAIWIPRDSAATVNGCKLYHPTQ